MKTKVCTGPCGKRLAVDLFAYRDRGTGHKRKECKECHNTAKRRYYKLSPEVRAKFAAVRLALRTRNRLFLINYLNGKSCTDCGYKDIRALQFDHVRGKKHLGVSYLINHSTSLKVIKTEIAKCEVVCANCHSIRTATRANWYKLQHCGRA